MSPAQYKALKPILGRDNVRVEKKYQQAVASVEPMAIVICVSNYEPTEIPYLREDTALLEKLIVVKFPAEASIPIELQIPNIEQHIDHHLPELFNWALYAPFSVIQNHLRATNYNNYRQGLIDPESIGGFVGFLRDNFVYTPDPNSFTPMPLFKEILEGIYNNTKEEELLEILQKYSTNKAGKPLGLLIEKTLSSAFGKSVEYKRDPKPIKNQPRYMGIKNLLPTSWARAMYKGPYEYLYFKSEKVKIELDDPFYAEQKIAWIVDSVQDPMMFNQTQEAIKQHRLTQKAQFLEEFENNSQEG